MEVSNNSFSNTPQFVPLAYSKGNLALLISGIALASIGIVGFGASFTLLITAMPASAMMITPLIASLCAIVIGVFIAVLGGVNHYENELAEKFKFGDALKDTKEKSKIFHELAKEGLKNAIGEVYFEGKSLMLDSLDEKNVALADQKFNRGFDNLNKALKYSRPDRFKPLWTNNSRENQQQILEARRSYTTREGLSQAIYKYSKHIQDLMSHSDGMGFTLLWRPSPPL